MGLQLLDVFGKPTGGGRNIRTTSGGLVTILAGSLILWLLGLEIQTFFSAGFEPALVIDTARHERMDIILDVTFPHLPCSVLSVDAMDSLGGFQDDVDDKLVKIDLGPDGQPLDPAILERQRAERDRVISARLSDPNYKGSCFGALPDEENCRTCEDVRRAYAAKNWRFHDGSGFEQCQEEKYAEFLQENKNNGCRVSGRVSVSKVPGKIHFAPGDSFFQDGKHSHDLSAYNLAGMPYTFDHIINRLSFGEGSESELEDPLKGFHATTDQKQFVFSYYTKVVGTEFNFLNGTRLDTNQYSVTRHKRPLVGGSDEDHPNSYHSQGGMPGAWFHYEISAMRVVNTERRGETFSTLLMNICAITGAVITTAALVDRSVYAMDRVLKEKKNR